MTSSILGEVEVEPTPIFDELVEYLKYDPVEHSENFDTIIGRVDARISGLRRDVIDITGKGIHKMWEYYWNIQKGVPEVVIDQEKLVEQIHGESTLDYVGGVVSGTISSVEEDEAGVKVTLDTDDGEKNVTIPVVPLPEIPVTEEA